MDASIDGVWRIVRGAIFDQLLRCSKHDSGLVELTNLPTWIYRPANLRLVRVETKRRSQHRDPFCILRRTYSLGIV